MGVCVSEGGREGGREGGGGGGGGGVREGGGGVCGCVYAYTVGQGVIKCIHGRQRHPEVTGW